MKRIGLFMGLMVLAVNGVAAQSWKNETLKYALYIGPIKAGEARFVGGYLSYHPVNNF